MIQHNRVFELDQRSSDLKTETCINKHLRLKTLHSIVHQKQTITESRSSCFLKVRKTFYASTSTKTQIFGQSITRVQSYCAYLMCALALP